MLSRKGSEPLVRKLEKMFFIRHVVFAFKWIGYLLFPIDVLEKFGVNCMNIMSTPCLTMY